MTRARAFGVLHALLAVCFLLVPGLASAFPSAPADPTQRLHDYVNLFPPDEAERFEHEIRAYEQITGIQSAVLVVHDLENLEPFEYANQVHRAWGVGRPDQPGSGIVLLFSMTGGSSGRGRIFINPGRRLGQVLLDSQCGEIVRNTTVPIWNSGNGQENRAHAIEETFRAVRRQIGDTPWASRPESIHDPDTANDALRRAHEDGQAARQRGTPTGPGAHNGEDDDLTTILVIIGIFAAIGSVLFLLRPRRRSSWGSSYTSYGGGGYSGGGSSSSIFSSGGDSGGDGGGWGGGGGDSFGGGGDAGGGGGGGDA